jgi:hypothetical protein
VSSPGFTTVTVAVPAAEIRSAGTKATSCVALTKLVDSAVPFHVTWAPERKPVPFTVSVNAAAPGATDAGLRPEIATASAVIVVGSLQADIGEPPPVTVAALMTWEGALEETFAVTVMAG